MRCLIVVVALAAASLEVAGQIPTPPPQQQPQPQDTIPVPRFRTDPPISPLGAAGRSLLLPGWGQAVMGRRVTGAAFVFWEGLTMTMTIKSIHQQNFQEQTGAETAEDKKSEVQDWAFLWGFNHLLSAAEAYVATLLWDFPARVESRAFQDGSVGVGVAVYWARVATLVN